MHRSTRPTSHRTSRPTHRSARRLASALVLTALAAPLAGTAALTAAPATASPTGPEEQPPSDGSGNPPEGTVRERGLAVDCTGSFRGHEVFTSVYENDAYTNVVQVVLREGVGGSRQTRAPFVDGRDLRASLRVDGARAVVVGTVRRVGERTPVSEVREDAGQRITVEGWNRPLRADLVLRRAGRSVPLTCTDGFAYDLQVTREDIV